MTAQISENPMFLEFSELNAPIRIERAQSLIPLISTILAKWQIGTTNAARTTPCMTITSDGRGGYFCKTPEPNAESKRFDAVNAVCELVVELAWEQIRSNPSWLCLHCAAVEFNGRLVLFPNRWRAGKSTLTAILAARGHRVFTDDFLPVQVDETGHIFGRANGILPRIRLPLPESFSVGFGDWVAVNPGPRNARYQYLTIDTLAPRGTLLPIGAVVFLDRANDTDTSLETVSPVQALDNMISQNFARTLHSGRILQASQGVIETAALYRLCYASAEDAATLLADEFSSWPHPAKAIMDPQRLQDGGADLSLLDLDKPRLVEEIVYSQADNVTAVQNEDALYLSDPSGLGVHRLNPGSIAIWQLLEEPANMAVIVDLLCSAFPEVPQTQIEQDTRETLRQFAKNGLIVPADPAFRVNV